MATYVIGDVHGCDNALKRLLAEIDFSPSRDLLWLVGDLVNRGSDSVGVLRWAMDHSDRITCVLGNHDVRLLGIAHGACRPRDFDSFDDVLKDRQADELLHWLSHRRMLHVDGAHVMVHAGLVPQWTPKEAQKLEERAYELWTGPEAKSFLESVLGPPIRTPPPPSKPRQQAIWAAQVMTRIRVCTPEGIRCTDFTGRPSEAPDGCHPWFDVPSARPKAMRIFFGHWAMLGVYVGSAAVGLDGGCVYGGTLNAFRLEDNTLFQVPA